MILKLYVIKSNINYILYYILSRNAILNDYVINRILYTTFIYILYINKIIKKKISRPGTKYNGIHVFI